MADDSKFPVGSKCNTEYMISWIIYVIYWIIQCKTNTMSVERTGYKGAGAED